VNDVKTNGGHELYMEQKNKVRTSKQSCLWAVRLNDIVGLASLCVYRFTDIAARRIMGWLHCALAAAQHIVIGPICLWVGVSGGGWVCYHDNSKLRASILTKLICR